MTHDQNLPLAKDLNDRNRKRAKQWDAVKVNEAEADRVLELSRNRKRKNSDDYVETRVNRW